MCAVQELARRELDEGLRRIGKYAFENLRGFISRLLRFLAEDAKVSDVCVVRTILRLEKTVHREQDWRKVESEQVRKGCWIQAKCYAAKFSTQCAPKN